MVTRSYRLLCVIPALAKQIELNLRLFGWEAWEHAQIGLLIDGPWGIALHELERMDPNSLVVITDNPCPEYGDDLWNCGPRGLLARGHSMEDLAEALHRASSGETFRHTPRYDIPLTSMERQLLRYSAMGWDNRRIAQGLDLSEGTVRNGLSRVFKKLNFENRTQLALYYWGLWHLLDRESNTL